MSCKRLWSSHKTFTVIHSNTFAVHCCLPRTDSTMIPTTNWKIRKVRHESKLANRVNSVSPYLSSIHSRRRSSFLTPASISDWIGIMSLLLFVRVELATIGIKWKENKPAQLLFVFTIVFSDAKLFWNQHNWSVSPSSSDQFVKYLEKNKQRKVSLIVEHCSVLDHRRRDHAVFRFFLIELVRSGQKREEKKKNN